MTVPEVRRLLLALIEPPERFAGRLRWSIFRRRHQAGAKAGHTARRARHGLAPPCTPAVHVLPVPALELTDDQWARIAPLLPPQTRGSGRPLLDHRAIVGGMLWVAGTGGSWRDIPSEFGPWQTIYSRYRRWRRDGLWQRIVATFQDPSAHSSL